VDGGFAAIAKTQLPKTDFMCQSKLQKLSWFPRLGCCGAIRNAEW